MSRSPTAPSRATSPGTSTPLATFSDADLTITNPTTMTLDADGRFPTDVRLLSRGYKFIVKDADDVTQYTIDNVTPASVFADLFGRSRPRGPRT